MRAREQHPSSSHTIGDPNYANSGLERLYNRAVVLLDVIEPVAMETGRVTVDATVMAREIAASGRIF